MEITQVGVLGAGAMGSGIAQAVAQAGVPVKMMDLSEVLVRGGVEKIGKTLSRSVEKGKLSSQQKEEILKRIEPSLDPKDLIECGLIIEAVFEDLTLKLSLFERLDALCLPETIFASNTSTLSITRMAAGVSRSGRFLGLHFFNPVPAMRLVEVIPGLQTSQETVDQGIDFIKRIKKVPVVAKDCPGFLVNRIVMPYAGEAMLAAQEGAALPTEIDEAMKKAGFPMGPLALNDMVGIDVGVHTFPPMHEGYGEKFPVPVLFEKLLQAGRLGLKSGKGIYVNGLVDDEFLEIIKKIQAESGVQCTEFSPDRLILRQVNEAVCCLQEKIASGEGIDRAMVLGTGFPADEKGVGGPLHWADERGLDWVLDKLNYFKNTLGTRFWPHFLLKQYVAAGYLGRKVGKGFFEY
ncbi:MAG TPA: 3-hydroxyacyl-CoA dehydrogenase [Thermodesulfobacteriota bacterium]|nr:3-hydroxyacyl-CoA dehydrogenase [Thermodesulfobacteriota bacterium]